MVNNYTEFKNYTKFIPNYPNDILNLSFAEFKKFLKNMLGENKFLQAYQHKKFIDSPVKKFKNTEWFKQSKIIGINPRILGSFFNIVKYATTFSENAIHIMPFFETGHQGSLYVQNSWQINQEFFDVDLAKDGFDTIEKQLKVTINLLHALKKVVGFDALGHVDSFSKIVFLNPKFFEWTKLNKNKTKQLFPPDVDYNTIYIEVENEIINFIKQRKNYPSNIDNLFKNTTEEYRDNIIFGKNSKKWCQIRLSLIDYIREKGYETLPVTEHAPSRPIIFDKIVNNDKSNWAAFKVKNKSKEAVILGCVTPYKWYKVDTKGYPITEKIEKEVWAYFINKYSKLQKNFNFDFLRADMAHNQLSHSSESVGKNKKQEFWKDLKFEINKSTPYFATLAEAFYNTYYIDGYSDMANKDFDVVLGNLNYQFLNENYINYLKDFINIFPKHFKFSPCICLFSNDADKKENNIFYQSLLGNEIRLFTAYFLNLPSYMGMGFELRKTKPRFLNEYTFNFIKETNKPYRWGNNIDFYSSVIEMRNIYKKIYNKLPNPIIKLCEINSKSALSWIYLDKQKNPKYLFCFNLDSNLDKIKILINTNKNIQGIYSNIFDDCTQIIQKDNKTNVLALSNFFIGNCAIFEFI